MLVADFEIIITKPFPTALMLSPFGFYGDILKLVYTTYVIKCMFGQNKKIKTHIDSEKD